MWTPKVSRECAVCGQHHVTTPWVCSGDPLLGPTCPCIQEALTTTCGICYCVALGPPREPLRGPARKMMMSPAGHTSRLSPHVLCDRNSTWRQKRK